MKASDHRWQKQNLAKLLVTLLLIIVRPIQSSTSTTDELKMVRFRNAQTVNYHGRFSMMGGAQIAIEGTGFGMESQNNSVRLKSLNSGLTHLTFKAPPQTEDDAFQSNTIEGQYYYTTPSLTDIFGIPLEAFNGASSEIPSGTSHAGENPEEIIFEVLIYNLNTDTQIADPNQWSKKTLLKYEVGHTPLLMNIVPSQVIKGQPVTFYTIPKGSYSHYVRPDNAQGQPVEELKIDGIKLETADFFDETYKMYQYIGLFTGYAGDQKPTKDSKASVRFNNGFTYEMSSARQCNFAGTECWTMQTLPAIDSIDKVEGFVSGGQTLQITGSGFSGIDQEVTIDGVECLVIESSDEMITCLTGPASKASLTGVWQPGTPGISKTYHVYENQVGWPSYHNLPEEQVGPETVQASYEFLERRLESVKAGNRAKGWFKAPETGNYKFYFSSTSYAGLHFNSQTPFDPLTAQSSQTDFTQDAELEQLCSIRGGGTQYDFRQYFRSSAYQSYDHYNFNARSDWLHLQKDQYYKIFSQSLQIGQEVGHTVSVEFEKDSTESHPKTNYKVQHLEIAQDGTHEEWDVTILNPDGKTFKIVLAYPDKDDPLRTLLWTSAEIRTDLEHWKFSNIIGAFFRARYGWNATQNVKRTDYDAQDVVTTDKNLIVKTVYSMKSLNLLNYISFSQISYTAKETDATITFTTPQQNGKISTPPLQGGFRVQCPDETGKIWQTRPKALKYSTFATYIQNEIDLTIPHLRFKTRVTQQADYRYKEVGRTFQIQFVGYEGNPPDCELISDDEDPMTGSPNLRFIAETIREYGKNLLFEPIPNELIYTNVDKPQVSVKIDGLQALCRHNDCGYTYVETSSLITGQSLNGLQLTIQGVSLPTTNSATTSSDLQISFASEACLSETIVASETQITCTLSDEPQAGDWDVEVQVYKGLVPVDQSIAQITVPLQVDSVEREIVAWEDFEDFEEMRRRLGGNGVQFVTADDLNVFGGDILILKGFGFSKQAKGSEVTFGDDTSCIVITSNKNQIKCRVDGFDESLVDLDQEINVKVKSKKAKKNTTTGRGDIYKEFTITKAVKSKPKKFKGLSVTPNRVSPVVKQDLVIEIEKNFPQTNFSPSDFRVILVDIKNKKKDPNVTIELPVLSTDPVEKTLTVRYPGANIDTYYIRVTHSAEGRIDHKPLKLIVETIVTQITTTKSSVGSNRVGSLLGGQLVTISGSGFSPSVQQNRIKVDDIDCLVKEVSECEIVCQIEMTPYFAGMSDIEAKFYVYQGAQNLASFDNDHIREYTFTTPEATIETVETSFDTTLNQLKITLTGTGFDSGDLNAVKVFLDGDSLQNTISVTSTEAQIVITQMQSNQAEIEIVMPDGYPAGVIPSPLIVDSGFTSITPPTGTSGGTTLTVRGFGFGPETTNFDLYHQQSNQFICREKEIIEYGVFTCLTIPLAIAATDTLKIQIGTDQFECANTQNPSDCKIELNPIDKPIFTNVEQISETQVKFTGANFAQYDQTLAIFQGVTSSSGIINSDTEVVVTWDLGVPISVVPSQIELRFYNDFNQNRRRLLNTFEPGTTFYVSFVDFPGLQVPLIVNSNTENLNCSFAGGCPYEISALGLTSSLQASAGNKVDFCGQECLLDLANSSSGTTLCTLPALPTIYSVDNFKLRKASPLANKGVWSGTTSPTELAKLFDEDETTVLLDTTQTNCFFQVDFPLTYTARLERLEFFITSVQDKSPYVDGNAKIQGSNDGGSTWTDILVLDQNVHCGWNSKPFESGSQPQYNAYRWQGAIEGSCTVGEIRFNGILAIDDNNSSYECTPKLILDGTETDLNSVVFDESFTPVLTGMSQRFGSVLGGESLTFAGELFSANAQTTVTIDSRNCAVTAQSATEITCTTSDKPYVPDEPSLTINVAGFGNAATQGLIFRYVSKWSDEETWGSQLAPVTGDAVEIPRGQHLLVDVDSTPQLSFVVVEGSLIFVPNADDENHERTFDAAYIMVRDGYFEAGTEEFPYTSKLTITMHSEVGDPTLPLYGNKVLAVRVGQLEMHGKPRETVWTTMQATADVGATEITLSEPVDWAVGEQIAIASTDFNGRQSEERTIAAISNENSQPLITLDTPLAYKHYAAEYAAGGESIEMRAEVGLLSRNVKFQGDESTSASTLYGAHILVHSPGDETSTAHIANVELFNVGQAFKQNRYPINLSKMGYVPKSYIRDNSIHSAFNRAIAMNSVQYLRIRNNFVYKASGHAIFTEFALETNNVIEDNLVMDTRASFSLLNTDMTPAAILLQHPNNIVKGNRAAGSDSYGIWYNPKNNVEGNSSCQSSICPENAQIGEFTDNVAHSNGRYGLRIYENLLPREYPCAEQSYSGNPADPYPSNRPLIAEFRGLVSFKNGRNGAMGENLGAVQFIDFKVADNREAGMQVSRTDKIIDGFAKIVNGVTFGYTENAGDLVSTNSPRGVIGPRTENFTIEGTKFVNFDINSAVALEDCSHCFAGLSTDSGARTITTKQLQFDVGSVPRRVRYQTPRRGIWRDTDGTLTGLGSPAWLASYFKHLDQPECTYSADTISKFDGLICSDAVQIRRIVFYNYKPATFDGLKMKILPYDYANVTPPQMTAPDLAAYVADEDNYSVVEWRELERPKRAWAMPYVTGHRYRIHWAEGVDFEQMDFELSERWQTDDQPMLINTNYTDEREAINVIKRSGNFEQIPEGTINSMYPIGFLGAENLETGDNYLPTDVKEFEFAVNGKNPEKNRIRLTAVQCVDCSDVLDDNGAPNSGLDPNQVAWSDPTSWPNNQVPQADAEVIIPSNVDMLLDVAETPILKRLEINGRLTFKNDIDVHLQAKIIWVRKGEFFIGTETTPYEMQGKITLHGHQTSDTLVLSASSTAGNKVLANTSQLKFYGKERSTSSRLALPALAGDSTIYLGIDLDWQAGDQIYLAPSSMQHTHSDYATLDSYNAASGVATLTSPLSYYHFGASYSLNADYEGLAMQTEVVLISRNVKICGSDEDAWGGQIYTTDIIDGASFQSGITKLSNVELFRMGQRDTTRAAIRFEQTNNGVQGVMNSVSHTSQGWHMYVNFSRNVEVHKFSSIGSKQAGIVIDSSTNVNIVKTNVFDVAERSGVSNEYLGAFLVCIYGNPKTGTNCSNVRISNSIAAGAIGAGFVAPGFSCDDTGDSQEIFIGNVAHSIKGAGHVIYPDPLESGSQRGCFQVNQVRAYKNQGPGLVGHFATKQFKVNQVVLVDNQLGLSIQTGLDEARTAIVIEDSFIFGESSDIAKDCPGSPMDCFCERKGGFMLGGASTQPRHPINLNKRAVYEVWTDSAFASTVRVSRVEFKNFLGTTACGDNQTVFFRNEYARNYIPPHTFQSCKFDQVDSNGFYYMEPAPLKWASTDICGDFPCTAPQNNVLTFLSSNFKNTQPAFSKKNKFQVMAKNDPTTSWSDKCTEFPGWNGVYCKQQQWSMLVFESLDEDAFTRAVQPVNMLEPQTGYTNKLNAQSSRNENYYASLKRRASFSAQLDAKDKEYTVEFTGTAPKKMRFELLNTISNKGVIVKIPFKETRAYTVKAEGQVVAEVEWDEVKNQPKNFPKNFCGENRQVGISNTLEIYIKKNCIVELIPRDAIKTKLRLEWTLEEFYATGGTIRFAEKIAAALGIESNRIKTVAVYEGSVIVDFFIQTILDEPEPVAQLQQIKETLVEIVTTGVVDLGAPVLGLMSDDELLAGDPIPPQEGASFAGENGQNDIFSTDRNAIVKDSNLWDAMVTEKQLNEQKRADYDKAKRNQKITKTITKVIENARFNKDDNSSGKTPIRQLALLILSLAIIFASILIYALCKCLQRNEQMLAVQAEVKAVQQRGSDSNNLVEVIEPQLDFYTDDQNKVDFAQATRNQSLSKQGKRRNSSGKDKLNAADETESSSGGGQSQYQYWTNNHRRSLSNFSIGSNLTTKKMLSAAPTYTEQNSSDLTDKDVE